MSFNVRDFEWATELDAASKRELSSRIAVANNQFGTVLAGTAAGIPIPIHACTKLLKLLRLNLTSVSFVLPRMTGNPFRRIRKTSFELFLA
jgi:hypothetical protein